LTIGSRLLVIATLTLLGACGKPLGTYEVRDIKLIPGAAFTRVDPEYSGPRPPLIRIEFTSTTDLEVAQPGHDLYVHGDLCPLKNEYQLGILGPYYDDLPRLLSRRITSYKRSVDGHVTMSIESTNRHPPRDRNTGRYVYTAYLALSEPKRQFSEAYDLRQRPADLCLRIDSPGYYIIPSRSEIFIIKGDVIQRALGSSLGHG
jgi:hypothetical protein